MNAPVFASSRTYTPLFPPSPTTSRASSSSSSPCRPRRCSRITLTPEPPISHFSPSDSAAHQVTAAGWCPHACNHGSWPCTRYDHRGAPVFTSNATTDLIYEPGNSQDSVKPPCAAWQAVTLAGSVYGCPNVPYTKPSRTSTAGGENIVAPAYPPGRPPLSGTEYVRHNR